MAMAQARVEHGGRGRSVFIFGTTSGLPEVMQFRVGQGSFLPPGDPRKVAMVAVLGTKAKREIFGDQNALGRFVRVAGYRLRVIGVMEPKGQMVGFGFNDSVFVPVATVMQMFNLDEVVEIDVLFAHERLTDQIVESVTAVLSKRHGGEEDFTINTQTQMLEVFDQVTSVITAGVTAIGAMSLLVGAIGILTIMWIAVNERVEEIGLMRAFGATPEQVQRLFLIESIILTGIGGSAGIGLGLGITFAGSWLIPGLPLYTPPEYILGALVVSLAVGLASGVVPARRAAALHPVEALRAE